MVDIELVIKIPEDSYKATCNGWMLPLDVDNVVQGIKNGTPLPKGHGKLKDTDAMIKRIANLPKCPNGHSEVYDEAMIINMINDELTIIEADKAGSENP